VFWHAHQQPIAEPLMRSLEVIVLHVLLDRSPETPLAENHQSIQALRLD
jgi:hypothetical protein